MAHSATLWLGKLLLAEVCLLSFVAGILAWRWTGPGLLMLFLVILLDLPRARSLSLRPFAYGLLLVLVFGAGYSYTGLREPTPPSVPGWLAQATAKEDGSGGQKRAPYLQVLAKVESCAPLPGGRLRMILGDIVLDPAYTVDQGEEDTAGVYAGKAVWTWATDMPDAGAPLPGQIVEARLRFLPVHGFANPGTWDTESYWRDRGVFFKAWSQRGEQPFFRSDLETRQRWSGEEKAISSLDRTRLWMEEKRAELHAAYSAALPEGSAGTAILPALIFGDRSQLTSGHTDLFARSTLAHSLALSGLHLGFAALAGFVFAQGLGRLFPGLWLRISRPKLAMVLALPIAALYLWLGQAPISLVRAACMLFFWGILMFVRWPRVLLDGLFAALACILIHNPLALFDLSLQLSALSVGVIALCLPGIVKASWCLLPRSALSGAQRENSLLRSGVRGALTIAGISFCIQVALLPLTLRAFGASGLLFPLNILWLPVLSVVVLPLAFAGLITAWAGAQSLASALLHIASFPCDLLVALLTALERADLLLAPIMPRLHWMSMGGYWLLCLSLPVLSMRAYGFARQYKGLPVSTLAAGSRKAWASLPGLSPAKQGSPAAERAFFKNFPALSQRYWQKASRFIWLLLPFLCGSVLFLLPVGIAWQELRETSVRLRLLDVGQGQAALVEWSGIGPEKSHGRVLVDGGGFFSDSFDVGKAVLSPVLTDNALPRLNAVINSHPDADHLSGLLFILEEFQVGRYFGNGDKASPSLRIREERAMQRRKFTQETLAAGDIVPLAPGLWFEVIWPDSPDRREAEGNLIKGGAEKRNNASLVLRLVWQGHGLALLCGDAEKPVLKELVRRHREKRLLGYEGVNMPENRETAEHFWGLETEVLVLPHHGAAGSLVPAFYDVVKPVRALASCGFANRWGYPARSVVTALRERDIVLHSTAESGQISVRWASPQARATYSVARQAD